MPLLAQRCDVLVATLGVGEHNSSTLKEVASSARSGLPTTPGVKSPFRVEIHANGAPRVTPCSRPWADGYNPVGIERNRYRVVGNDKHFNAGLFS